MKQNISSNSFKFLLFYKALIIVKEISLFKFNYNFFNLIDE